ncbi:hypothetical protein AB1N83_009304 [Pleurotus pulmonarius]
MKLIIAPSTTNGRLRTPTISPLVPVPPPSPNTSHPSINDDDDDDPRRTSLEHCARIRPLRRWVETTSSRQAKALELPLICIGTRTYEGYWATRWLGQVGRMGGSGCDHVEWTRAAISTSTRGVHQSRIVDFLSPIPSGTSARIHDGSEGRMRIVSCPARRHLVWPAGRPACRCVYIQ